MKLEICLEKEELDRLETQMALLYDLTRKVDDIMRSLKEVLDATVAAKTDIDSLGKFVQGLEDQISAIPGFTADQTAMIDTIFSNVDQNDKAVVAAMKMNVPVTPAPAALPPVIEVPVVPTGAPVGTLAPGVVGSVPGPGVVAAGPVGSPTGTPAIKTP